MANNVLAKMAVLISANNAQFNQAMRNSQKQMNAFQSTVSALNKTLGAVGLGFGLLEVARGIEYSIGVMANFEKSMSEVRAITNANDKEFQALTDSAINLGKSTFFTAKQVSELQTAYGRLGFSTKEILNSTEATLQLATATGEDLAKSADIAGSTLRAFNLDASEMQRVVDVMAASFNKSALGLDNFGESMKYVAPVAEAANISLEETTAMLGVLADAGIRGSMAGTSLRKIISDVKGETGTLAERLQKLADKGFTGADAMDEVGRTAYASLLILVKNIAKVNEASEAYQNVTGEAKKMADLMSDNLIGDFTKLTSAVDGLILQFRHSTGTIREVVQALTELVNWFSKPEVVAFMEGVAGQALFLNYIKAANALSKVNDEGERMEQWLEDMDKKAILDAFGDPDKIKASKDWNPFGSMFDEKSITAAAEALNKYREQYTKLLNAIPFQKPKTTGGNVDTSDDFFHRELNMDPLSSLGIDPSEPAPGVVKEIEYNHQLHESLLTLEADRERQLEQMQATAEMAVTMGESIGSAFEQMMNGTMNFAQGLAKVTEEIITMYLRQSIAAMIRNAIAKGGPFPFANVALAAAGIGVVKGLFSQIGATDGGGSSSSLTGRTPSQMKLEVGGRIRGYDIALNQENEGYRRSRVG